MEFFLVNRRLKRVDKGRQFTFKCKKDNKSHVMELCNLNIVESQQYTDLGI